MILENLADLVDKCKIVIHDLRCDEVQEGNVGQEQDDPQMMRKKSEMVLEIASKL